jgi:hypothetical protein
MDWFVDTIHTPEVVKQFENILARANSRREASLNTGENKSSIAEAQELLEKHYPGWLLTSMTEYSSDYPHLSGNWNAICRKLGVRPKKIVLVADIQFDSEHKDINAIAEIMTKNGYCIRRQGELQPCSVCNKAIPTQGIWAVLYHAGLPVPREWKDHCSTCNSSSIEKNRVELVSETSE